MAMKHHPDKGGDPEKFKEVTRAYEEEAQRHEAEMKEMKGLKKAAEESVKAKAKLGKEVKAANDRCKKLQEEIERLRAEKKEHVQKATDATEVGKDQTVLLQRGEKDKANLQEKLTFKTMM